MEYLIVRWILETLILTSLKAAEKKNGRALIDSRTVAEVFGKSHDNVLKAIENLDCSPEFRELNFEVSKYKVAGQKRSYPCYNMTKDGFVFLVMGFTGAKMIMEGAE